VYLIVDNDAAGESAADELARRLVRQGRRVTLARAAAGKDVNDALLIAQRAVA
jgi:DNA primase